MDESLRAILMEGEQAGARYRLASLGRTPQGTAGSQLAHAAGESMEFMEHRDYQPGDDLRRMNWSAYARSDRLVVKVFRQEVSPHFDLVIDGSRSIALPGTQKLRAALGLAAALTTAAANSGYHSRVFQTGDGCHPIPGGSERPQAWNRLDFSSRQTPADSFRLHAPTWRPHGVRVMISDFLWLGNPLEILNPLADRAAATLLIQVLAAEDADPGTLGNQQLVDCESDETLEVYLDQAGLERYRQNLARHQQAWRMAATKVGARFITVIAENVVTDWDLSAFIQEEILSV